MRKVFYNIMLKNINTQDKIEFIHAISNVASNDIVKQMQNFRQHYDSSCYEHCLEVSYISFLICKKLKLDYVSAARAGLLHDLFLYDWRNSRKKLNLSGYHAFVHPKIALQNSLKLFNLNKKEQDIIVKHMWPITLFELPKYVESYIITLVDKYSALRSAKNYYQKHIKTSLLFKYAYVFLTLVLLFNI